MTDTKWFARAVLIAALGLTLTACSGPEPSDTSDDASAPSDDGTQTSESGSNGDSAASPSPSQTTTQEASESEALPIERQRLIGYWQTRGGSSEQAPYVYHFQADGTLTVYQGRDTVALRGRYEITLDRELQLTLRDPDTDEVQQEMTLRLMVRRGHAEYAFEVQPDGGTLWLRRVTPEGDEATPE